MHWSILNYQFSLLEPPNTDYIKSIKDVPGFRYDPQSKTILIYIQVYFDDYGLTRNPNTKVSAMYFTLLNLEYWLQSDRDSVYQCLVCDRSTLNQITNEGFVEYLVDDLERLSEEVIELSDGYRVKVIAHSSAADGEANNSLMAIEGYKAKFCKQCQIHHRDLKCLYSGSFNQAILPRGMSMDHAFAKINSKIFKPKFFYAFDPFHDFEGIMQKVLNPMIKIYYIEGPNFRRNLVGFANKKAILLEKYKSLQHRNGTISDIDKDGVISGTFTQIADFFLLFGYLDDLINRNADEFKLYLLLRKIYLFVMSEAIPKSKLDAVEAAIKNFLHEYHRIYVHTKMQTMIPKMHHLDHYTEFIKEMGNMKYFHCARYERKHQDPKHEQRSSHQFKNKAFSIAKWGALVPTIRFQLIEDERIRKSGIDLDKPENFIYRNFIDHQREFTVLKEVKIKKVHLKPKKVFRIRSSTPQIDRPEFIQFELLVKQEERYLLIGQRIKSANYLGQRCAYRVEYENLMTSIDVDQLHHTECIFIPNEFLIIKDWSSEDDF